MPNVNRKAKGDHTQSAVFMISAGWTKASSRAWCRNHGLFTDGYERTDTSHRWRQFNPDNARFHYRNKVIKATASGATSILYVLGFPGSDRKG